MKDEVKYFSTDKMYKVKKRKVNQWDVYKYNIISREWKKSSK